MSLEQFIYALTGMSVDEYLKVLTKDYESYLKEKIDTSNEKKESA